MSQRKRSTKALWLAGLIILFVFVTPLSVQSRGVLIQCILYYSPTCPHCHEVITQSLPPLVDAYGGTPTVVYIPPVPGEEPAGPSVIGMYGDTLEILYINTLTELGHSLYGEAVERYQIPTADQVVPLMIINDVILTGGIEIPQRFTELIDAGLAAGGISWPDLPGLESALTSLVELPTQTPDSPTDETPAGVIPESTEPETAPPSGEPPFAPLPTDLTMLERIRLDPFGNGIAILLLIGMLLTVGYVGTQAVLSVDDTKRSQVSSLIPILCLIGISIAGYLTYIESSGDTAVCGPIGDCNAVQQSQYARLFGLVPIGVIGLIGYIAIFICWVIAQFSSKPVSIWANFVIFAFASVGILFSIYLTFLEPFVIGASCAWCLASALITTLLFWLSKDAGILASRQLRDLR